MYVYIYICTLQLVGDGIYTYVDLYVHGLQGFHRLGYCPPIVDNRIGKKLENVMETGNVQRLGSSRTFGGVALGST